MIRHNSNWGILVNEETQDVRLAPVYDCGSCLFPKPRITEKQRIISDENEINNRVFVFPTSAIKIQDRKINYFDFISSLQQKDCTAALKKITPRIHLGEINGLIEGISCISTVEKEFYKVMLKERKEKILEYSLRKALQQENAKGKRWW